MSSSPNSTGAPKYRFPLEASNLRMPAEKKRAVVSLQSLHWAKAAHENMVATRNERIAIAAYLLAEARGFAPGHDADDWLRAQLRVDAQDGGGFPT